MRDVRISLLLLISFVLLLASFLVLCIWGYRAYNTRDVNRLTAVKSGQARQDSLVALYNSTIGKLEEKLVLTSTAADSIGQNIDGRLQEFHRLKNELSELLQNASTNEDFVAARKKIDELQNSIRELRRTNKNISDENMRLYDLLSEMRNSIQPGAEIVQSPSPVTQTTNTNYTASINEEDDAPVKAEQPKFVSANAKSPAVPALYAATDLNLEKIASRGESEQLELVGSFAIKNNASITTNEDVMVVVIQPNGKVLQKSAWESGTFQTTEGKKIYSCKLRIENPQGSVKKVTFSLNGDKQLTGNYVMQVYHKGWMIGNITKRV